MLLRAHAHPTEVSNSFDRHSTVYQARRFVESLPRGVRTVRAETQPKVKNAVGCASTLCCIREFLDVKREFPPMHKSPVKSSIRYENSLFPRCKNGFPYRSTNIQQTSINLNSPTVSTCYRQRTWSRSRPVCARRCRLVERFSAP